jgi:hypothetical protein
MALLALVLVLVVVLLALVGAPASVEHLIEARHRASRRAWRHDRPRARGPPSELVLASGRRAAP